MCQFLLNTQILHCFFFSLQIMLLWYLIIEWPKRARFTVLIMCTGPATILIFVIFSAKGCSLVLSPSAQSACISKHLFLVCHHQTRKTWRILRNENSFMISKWHWWGPLHTVRSNSCMKEFSSDLAHTKCVGKIITQMQHWNRRHRRSIGASCSKVCKKSMAEGKVNPGIIRHGWFLPSKPFQVTFSNTYTDLKEQRMQRSPSLSSY